jgi:hypothetical protein
LAAVHNDIAAPIATAARAKPNGNAAVFSMYLAKAIANRAATDATFRISQSLAGGVLANKDYLVYDAQIPGAGFITLTLGVTMAATDKLRVYASSANISFNAFGTELS